MYNTGIALSAAKRCYYFTVGFRSGRSGERDGGNDPLGEPKSDKTTFLILTCKDPPPPKEWAWIRLSPEKKPGQGNTLPLKLCLK